MSHKLAKLIKRQYQASKSASSKRAQSWTVGDSGPSRGSIANVTTGTFAGLMGGMAIGNTFFEGFRRLRPRYEAREPRDDGSERRRPEKNRIPIAFTSLLAIAILSVFASSATYAKPYSMTVTIDDSVIDMNVSPSKNGSFSKSSNSTVSVSTDNASGYTLSITGSNDNGRLVNSEDNDTDTNYLSSISSATTEEQFKALDATGYNNMWGYLPSKWDSRDNTAFLPSPTTTGHVLDHTTTANTEANKYTLAIGARVDTAQKIGAYSNTYVVLATANGTPYTITYKDDTTSNFPTDESATAEGDKVTISNLTPVKDGYTFLGWCSVSPANNNGTDTCSGTTYQPNGTWTIDQTASTNSLILYAMWSKNKSIDDLLYMQDFNALSSTDKASVVNLMETSKNYYLMDSRDREVYIIAKLKDGRVWMRDNLRLGSNDKSIALTPADTNIQSNWTLPRGAVERLSYYTEAKLNAAYSDGLPTINNVAYIYGQGSGKSGVYYNYCAASAGTYCYANDAGVDVPDTLIYSPYDICPKGWRMPTGWASGEYAAVYRAYNGAESIDDLQQALSTPLSGYIPLDKLAPERVGTSNGYWTSTTATSFQMFSYRVSLGNTDDASASRANAFSVRCILK